MNREEAEKHWDYTYKVIAKMLELCHVLYVESMMHGGKHAEEELKKIRQRRIDNETINIRTKGIKGD